VSDQKVYSVTALTAELKGLIASSSLSSVFVEGEISGWRVYASGHAYFSLKDVGALLNAVMFSRSLAACKERHLLKDGAKVRMWGQIDVYAPRGSYQLVVRQAWPVDAKGDLAAKFEEEKRRFAAEGLFDESRKRPLPFLPHRIGIVTSGDGAALHDMLKVASARFPNLEIRLFPARVQGVGAAEEIAAGVAYFNSCSDWLADVLIVGRGGGSIEDLWAFNEEPVVRAVASSLIPVVSAVGHETDFTLCDFAADIRAATPSNAAEIVVPTKAELSRRLDELAGRLVRVPISRGDYYAQRTDELSRRLFSALKLRSQEWRSRVQDAETRLRLLNPYAVLERGYSITTSADGKVLRRAADASSGATINTLLAAGNLVSVVA